MVEALRRADGDPTRKTPLSAINALRSIGGVALSYGPDKNPGSDRVFFTIMQADGSFKPVARLIKIVGQ